MDTNVLYQALNRANIGATSSRKGIILPEYRKLSDGEKFMYGFAQLCKECNVDTVKYTAWSTSERVIPIITALQCSDGSQVGMVPLLNNCGFNIKFK